MSESSKDKLPNLGMSDQERSNIVVSFIKAYLDGKVKINYPDAVEIKMSKDFLAAIKAQYGEDFVNADPMQLELALRGQFADWIKIVAGGVAANAEQRKQAIDHLFDIIVSGRLGHRIEGEFIGVATLESRLKDVEDKLSTHDDLLRELAILMRAMGGGQSH